MLRMRLLALAALASLAATPVLAGSEAEAGQAAAASAQAEAAPAASHEPGHNETAKFASEGFKVAAVGAKEAEPAKPATPDATLKVTVDLGTQTMTVKENGTVRYSWPVSSGTEEFPTPRGSYRPQWTAKMWYSKKYDNAPMPNAVFITGGVAIHGTSHVRSLGSPASHGCIRLAPGNAKTFYNLVHAHGLKSTRVSVFGTPKWRAPAVASRSVRPAAPARYAAAPRYVARGNGNSWFWGDDASSAYAPNFVRRNARRYPGAYYADPRPRVFTRPDGVRMVYVPRQRRAYYYDGGW